MKKKFLSLMMAAAVVATTSVSAFAAGNDVTMPDKENVTTRDDQDAQQNVTITGNVTDENGNMPSTSFKVTVPTAANFTVTENGFVGPTLEVKNKGPQEIVVYAQSFKRIGGGTGKIDTVKAQEIEGDTTSNPTYSRAHVALNLEGQSNQRAYLRVSNRGTGVYKEDTSENSAGDEGVELLSLRAGDVEEQKGSITLNGSAGTKKVNTAITDKFQLTLKIKKVTKGTEGAGSQEPGSVQNPEGDHNTEEKRD